MSTNLSPVAMLTPAQQNFAETAPWKEILKQALCDLRSSIPAIVKAFDPVKQVVTVQIAINERVKGFPTGPQWTTIGPIFNVPIILPRAGGFSLTLPIKAGDEGDLIFCDMCIDLWWSRGGVQNQFEIRRHDISDCGFAPGMWSQPNVLSNYSTDSAQLRSDDGSTYVEIAAGQIVNIVAPNGVNIRGNLNVIGTITATEEVTGNSIPLSVHTHPGVMSGGSDTGPPIP